MRAASRASRRPEPQRRLVRHLQDYGGLAWLRAMIDRRVRRLHGGPLLDTRVRDALERLCVLLAAAEPAVEMVVCEGVGRRATTIRHFVGKANRLLRCLGDGTLGA